MDILPLELRKLGLKEKEIAVYLAGLELGYTSAQKIAEKAGISRPTGYEIIKSLEEKGLMTESREKGRTYYTAESPDKLLSILRLEKRALEEKEREFVRIISALRAKHYLSEKSEIRTYQGQEGLKVLLDDFSQTQVKEIFILNPNPGWQKKYEEIKKRMGTITIKEISKKNIPGTLIIYDKIIYLPPAKKPAGLLIENQPLLELFKSLFLTLN